MGEEDEISIRDVVHLVAEAAGFAGEVVMDTSKADGQHKKTANNAKLREYLPGFTFTPIREGEQWGQMPSSRIDARSLMLRVP